MLRRPLAALAAILFAGAALAAGSVVTRTINDGSGTHTQQFWDYSGTGAGPLQPIVVTDPSGTGNPSGTLTDRSGTIAVANTAQQFAAANANRRGYRLQNNTTGDCWWNTLAVAVQSQPSFKLPAGGFFESASTEYAPGAISIICSVTGGISAREW